MNMCVYVFIDSKKNVGLLKVVGKINVLIRILVFWEKLIGMRNGCSRYRFSLTGSAADRH